jgi:hypothetical protein
MRHVPLAQVLRAIFAAPDGETIRDRLKRAHKKLARRTPTADRQGAVESNGLRKWSPLKRFLTTRLGKKCWYTEAEPIGCHLVIDHYRPFSEYWWLAYDPENFRVACSFANSPEFNELHNCAGGKGDQFPLLAPGLKAKGKNKLRQERPVILDPCTSEDCDLLAFQQTGIPALNPTHNGDAAAAQRVDQSLILLNLDHPDFNSKREQLYHAISEDVQTHEELPVGAQTRNVIKARLASRISPRAPFSSAARQFLQFYRNLDWVQDILNGQGHAPL